MRKIALPAFLPLHALLAAAYRTKAPAPTAANTTPTATNLPPLFLAGQGRDGTELTSVLVEHSLGQTSTH